MMKPLSIIVLFFICFKSLAQIPPELTWTQDYSGTTYLTGNQYFPIEAQACVFDTSGRLCVAGRAYDYRPTIGKWYEYLKIIKYNPVGNIYAQAVISGPTEGIKNQKVNKIVSDNATNNIYVLATYYYNDTRKTDIYLAKYSPKLVLVWDRFVLGADSSIDVGVDMELDADGNVIIAGNEQNDGTGNTTGQNIVVYKYSKSGSLLWNYSYTGAGKNTDVINALKIDHNKDVIAVGSTFNAAKGTQLLAFKLDKNNGTLKWDYKYNGDNTSSYNDNANDVDVDDNNDIYVCAAIQITGPVDKGLLLKLNAAGVAVFKKQVGYLTDPKSVIYRKFAVYIAGSNISGSFKKIKLSKFNTSGTQLFASTYSAAAGTNNYFSNMIISAAGNIYLTGRADNSYYYLSTDQSGNVLWDHLDAPNASDAYNGLCVAIDELHGVSAGCGYRHLGNGEGVWVSNYYTPTLLRSQLPVEDNSNVESLLNIYPNPASNVLTINCSDKNFKTEISDVTGRLILSETFGAGLNNLNIEKLAPGTYMVTVTSGSKKEFRKFIKQ